jgi:hypothetical protein
MHRWNAGFLKHSETAPSRDACELASQFFFVCESGSLQPLAQAYAKRPLAARIQGLQLRILPLFSLLRASFCISIRTLLWTVY